MEKIIEYIRNLFVRIILKKRVCLELPEYLKRRSGAEKYYITDGWG